jgi:hypothetical protein
MLVCYSTFAYDERSIYLVDYERKSPVPTYSHGSTMTLFAQTPSGAQVKVS